MYVQYIQQLRRRIWNGRYTQVGRYVGVEEVEGKGEEEGLFNRLIDVDVELLMHHRIPR